MVGHVKKLSLEDLPKYSPWPARLLGLSPFSRGRRSVEAMLREYDTDKYNACFEYLKKHPKATLNEIRLFERGGKDQPDLCVSMDGCLYESSVSAAYKLREQRFLDNMGESLGKCDTIIELGAGYGYNLALLKKEHPHHAFMGGDLSPNASKLGKKLLPESIAIHPFNFYDPMYPIFEQTSSNRIFVFTYHASEMLPDAEVFLSRLVRYKHRITSVIQLEPVYEMANREGSLLDLLRQKYIRINEYNTNLLTALETRPDIRVLRKQYDVFGINPLFPESLVEWHFA
jgi:hypothetical protein